MNGESIDKLQSLILDPSTPRVERLAAAYLLGDIARSDALSCLLSLAKDGDLPDEVADEIGRSLGRVASQLRTVGEVMDPHAYEFTPGAFDAFDQEVAIRSFVAGRDEHAG